MAIYSFVEYPEGVKTGCRTDPTIVGCGPYVRTHRRHFNQQSEYTYCRKPAGEAYVYCCHEEAFQRNDSDQDVLTKYVIPRTERPKVMERLHLMNITAYSLFGDEESLLSTLAYQEVENTMPNRTRYDSKYKACLLDPTEWERKADQLMEAASLFRDSIQATWESWSQGNKPVASDHFISIYFMLTSYAMENLFKAVIIRRDHVTLENELKSKGKLPSDLKDHDLFKLAKSCGFNYMNAGDEELLKKLSRSAVWYGRYPVPIEPIALQSISQAESESLPICLTSYHSTDDKSIQSWIERLRTILRNGPANQSNGGSQPQHYR